jgi:protein-L-isoaspartate(D-aspartate) O-methyltransferase
MLDALDIGPDDHVLHIGAGLGYSAAVIARMAGSVVAVEDDPGMAAEAQARLAAAGSAGVRVVQGALMAGAPDAGPYDAILIEGGVETVPDALLAQLKDGGRIGAIYMEAALGTARVGHKANGQVGWRFAFNAAAPVMAGFRRARGFAL